MIIEESPVVVAVAAYARAIAKNMATDLKICIAMRPRAAENETKEEKNSETAFQEAVLRSGVKDRSRTLKMCDLSTSYKDSNLPLGVAYKLTIAKQDRPFSDRSQEHQMSHFSRREPPS